MTAQPEAGVDEQPDLTDIELTILELERSWWKYPAAKETHVRDQLDISMTGYYAILNRLIDQPAALTHDPLLVRRLLRLRGARRAQRSSRRIGFDPA